MNENGPPEPQKSFLDRIPFRKYEEDPNSFFDQSSTISDLNHLEISNLAFPLLFIPFVSRTSEILGKRIFLKIDNKEILFNFNQSIYSNYLSGEIVEKSDKINIQLIQIKPSILQVFILIKTKF